MFIPLRPQTGYRETHKQPHSAMTVITPIWRRYVLLPVGKRLRELGHMSRRESYLTCYQKHETSQWQLWCLWQSLHSLRSVYHLECRVGADIRVVLDKATRSQNVLDDCVSSGLDCQRSSEFWADCEQVLVSDCSLHFTRERTVGMH